MGVRARHALLIAVAGLAQSGCVLARLYREPLPARAEILHTRTEDGWELGLVRYRPEGPVRGVPVLLLPGVINNARVVDLDEKHSLARWFASQGRDTWILNFRGTELSDKPDPAHGRSAVYSVDTIVAQDVPAAIRRIREATGAKGVDLVGHSMGGHLIYLYLARGGQGVNAAAVMGAQGRFLTGGASERAFVGTFVGIAQALGETVPAPTLVHALFPLYGTVESPLDKIGRSKLNVSDATWRKFMANAVDETSRDVFLQLDEWTRADRLTSFDGRFDYSARLSGIRTPVIVVAGKIDAMAPPTQVRVGYDLLGGPKQFLVAGEENGFEHDYGHGDLVMADRASVELWPRLLSFFESHEPLRPGRVVAEPEIAHPAPSGAAATDGRGSPL